MTGVHLLGLGGTISMHDTAHGAIPATGAAELAARVGGFGGAEDVALIGGSEVDFGHLEGLVTRVGETIAGGANGVVVTTGTDSIEEVAAWLSFRNRWTAPVVVTGAMVTGSRGDSDGPANLFDARAVAASGTDTDPLVVFGGRIFLGREVLKTSGLRRSAFDAPGRGPVGSVEGGRVSWIRTPGRRAAHGAPAGPIRPVPVVVAALGDDGSVLRHAAAGQPAIVVAANGAGNLPPAQAAAVVDLLDGDTLVVLSTRAPDAAVAPQYGYPGAVATLVAAGAVLTPGLTPHRARLLLTLGVAQGLDLEGLRDLVAREVRA